MIVDAHAHVFPPEVVAGRDTLVRDEPVFSVMYRDPAARMATVAELLAAMEEDGIDVSVVCGFPWRDAGRARVHNEYILDAARDHPGRIVALAAVDPLAPGARAEAERALQAGAAGLGEIGAYANDLSDPEVHAKLVALAGLCAETDLPLLLHTNEPVGHPYPGKSPMTLRGLYELVQACPHTRFQLAHLGGGIFFYESLRREVREVLANCVFDTAAAPFLYRSRLYPIFVSLAGPGRLLFGSDFPLLRLDRYQVDLDRAGLEQDVIESILDRNARSFWKLP